MICDTCKHNVTRPNDEELMCGILRADYDKQQFSIFFLAKLSFESDSKNRVKSSMVCRANVECPAYELTLRARITLTVKRLINCLPKRMGKQRSAEIEAENRRDGHY